MFISNQVSKFLIPTAIALVFTALAQWLTSETDRLSNRGEREFASRLAPKTTSNPSIRQVPFNTQSPLLDEDPEPYEETQNEETQNSITSSPDYPQWINYWQDRGSRWRQRLEAFWLQDDTDDTEEEWTIITDGSVSSSPVTQEITYQQISLSPPIQRLFSTPDSPGSIAIGVAEGTRTFSGGVTSHFWGHRDPANGVTNLGTFSYQHGARNAYQADWLQLARLQQQVTEIQRQATESGITLSSLELVAAADLANQSPEAGYAYISNLKQAYDRGFRGIEALLEARTQSFVNPQTQDLDAAGFGNNWHKLRRDQLRRLSKLQKALKTQNEL